MFVLVKMSVLPRRFCEKGETRLTFLPVSVGNEGPMKTLLLTSSPARAGAGQLHGCVISAVTWALHLEGLCLGGFM